MRGSTIWLSIVAMLAAMSLLIAGSASAALPATSNSSKPASTVTTLTSSATSSTYDALITFNVIVSTAHSGLAREGTVTFIDSENGSLLDRIPVHDGAAVFSTSALAPGVRDIEADYTGDIYYSSSESAPVAISVAAIDDATASQIDPAHDGAQPDLALKVQSLVKTWSVKPTGREGAGLQNALIADGKIFVTDAIQESGGVVDVFLYALNIQNGQTEWSASVPSDFGEAGLAYDGHAVFMLNGDGLLTAFDADTGQVNWSLQLQGTSLGSAPTAFDGMVFVVEADSGANVYGISEAKGVIDWTAKSLIGSNNTPAVDDDGVFLSFACQQDYRFSMSGTLIWHDNGPCNGGGASIPVLANGYAYDEGFENGGSQNTPEILLAADGSLVGTFADQTPPAFGSTNMYVFQNENLFAEGPLGTPDHWEFGNRTFEIGTAPVTDKTMVFVGARDGTVYGISSNGSLRWSGSTGARITGQSLALGDGLLVALAGNTVTVFGD